MKHTEGPWYSTPSGIYVRKVSTDPNFPDWNICEVNECAGLDDPETGKANARLIAASPDLLSACESAFDFLDGDERTLQETMLQLEQAIAKAKE